MPALQHALRYFSLVSAMLCLATTPGNTTENACGPMSPVEEQIIKLHMDNEMLTQKIKQLESIKAIPVERLRQKKALRLKEIAADMKL